MLPEESAIKARSMTHLKSSEKEKEKETRRLRQDNCPLLKSNNKNNLIIMKKEIVRLTLNEKKKSEYCIKFHSTLCKCCN